MFIERFFKLRDKGTTIRTEILGGATTFVTMAYIIVVNPAILSFAGIAPGPSTVATILAAVFGTMMMGLVANRPIAVAPYMGENAFIAFGLAVMGIGWQQRLGAVFISGLAFALITLFHIRSWLANSISASLKHSFAVGIGLFLAFIGLYETGIVTSSVVGMRPEVLIHGSALVLSAPAVPLKIGDLRSAQVLLALFGFFFISTLMYFRVRGGIMLGIAATAVLGYLTGYGEAPRAAMALPFVGEYNLSAIAFKMDIMGMLKLSMLPILLTLFLMGFLDTLGTLVGVGSAGNMLDEKGNFPDIERPMMVDAATCMFSAMVGTSTSGAYIESATGIKEGARTGLAAVTTAVLFGASLFFIPLIEPLQHLQYAYGPALIAVGLLMTSSIKKIDFDDLTELVPSFATIVVMVFTYNIANGLTAGLVLYPLFKIVTGRGKEISAGAAVLGLLCLVYYVFGLPH
jgi:AGZA family xanthine/uracil permease-like MFS transporter